MDPAYASAAELATQIIEIARKAEHTWRSHPKTSFLASQLFDSTAHDLIGTPMREEFDREAVGAAMRQDRALSTEVAQFTHTVAARLLWQRHRVVYSIDATLWQELGRTAPDDKLPRELFTFLPHPDPFIAFPEPITLPIDDGTGDRQRVVGVFVTGRTPSTQWVEREGREAERLVPINPLTGQEVPEALAKKYAGRPCSTLEPFCTGLSLSFVGLTEDARGVPVKVPGVGRDVLWTSTSLDVSDGDTFGEMVEGAMGRFGRALAVSAREEQLPLLLRQAVGALVYLCCQNADLRPLPPAPGGRNKKGKGSRRPKPPRVIEVGYRVGATLRAYRRRVEVERGAPTGQRVRPHVRRAHAHTYRYGPGRTKIKVLWLHPFLVGGEAEETTVVPLK